jgi:glycosyltransferase involved in cell wall biosynthesis
VTRRIARIIARLNVGGPARHVTWLAEAMSGGEFETALVTGVVPPGEDDMSEFAIEHGVTPIVIPEMSREISPLDIITIWKLFHFFRHYRPHIVHTHTAKAGAVGRAAGFFYRLLTHRRVKFVHTYHGHIFHSYYGRLKTRMFLLIERTLARMTDAIVVLSEQQRREIHETFGVGKREQFHVIPLGLDLNELGVAQAFQPAPPSPGGQVGKPAPHEIVAIVGRLAPIKNHDMFLRVAARLRDTQNVHFVIYGDGTERAKIAPRAAELGVTLAGTHPAAEIYSSIDIAALTSLNEGTPLSLIEAMAAGIPVISTAAGGVVDLLGDVVEMNADGYEVRERGITAQSNDDAGFANGLRRLLTDDSLRTRLAHHARTYARATYSKERLIADIIALYRSIGASGLPSRPAS